MGAGHLSDNTLGLDPRQPQLAQLAHGEAGAVRFDRCREGQERRQWRGIRIDCCVNVGLRRLRAGEMLGDHRRRVIWQAAAIWRAMTRSAGRPS